MPTAVRTRTIAAPQLAVWELIADAHHQPRWWPGLDRVEDVGADRFTQVLKTKRGRPIRADFLVIDFQAPWTAAWEQQLPGTPFARVLEESVIQLSLEPSGEQTIVTMAHRLKARGYSRTGGFMLRHDTAKRLDRVLAGLAGMF